MTSKAFDVDTGPRARVTDPETSHLAAKSVSGITALKEEILRELGGPVGLTDEALIAALRARGVSASDSGIRSRRSELEKAGDVIRCADQSETRFGRPCNVYIATEQGRGKC